MYKKYEEELKSKQRGFVDMQAKYARSEKENSELKGKVEQLSKEKMKLTEKWIRASKTARS